MQKIISLFQRNYHGDRQVRDEVTPGAEWVVAGEGLATRKYDGTCCLLREGKLYKRYELKQGKQAPLGFEPAQEADPVTSDIPGWLPVGPGPADRWHREAFASMAPAMLDEWDGYTFELCGPQIQGNPERFPTPLLILHGNTPLLAPRDYKGLQGYFIDNDIEGIVWYHPDRRMVKIKGRDFGIKRHPKPA